MITSARVFVWGIVCEKVQSIYGAFKSISYSRKGIKYYCVEMPLPK